MSQGKDRSIFTITSAHDPNSEPARLGHANVLLRELRLRRNYQTRYPLTLLLPRGPSSNSSSSVVSNVDSTQNSQPPSSASDTASLTALNSSSTSTRDRSSFGNSINSNGRLTESMTSAAEETEDGSLLLWDHRATESEESEYETSMSSENEAVSSDDSSPESTPRLVTARSTSTRRPFGFFRRSSRP